MRVLTSRMFPAADSPDRGLPRGRRPGLDRGGWTAGLLVLVVAFAMPGIGRAAGGMAPERLADTGLYEDFSRRIVRADNLPYTPQYPLWSDGATKRRWIQLPAGRSIDGSDPSEWRFPPGTKFWKEFSFGRRVETRYMELTEGGEWIFATYVWSEDGRDAIRVRDSGVRGVVEIAPGVRHDIPGRYDCLACHEGQVNRVLGFGALQLSPDRDPLAPHAEEPAPGSIDLAWIREQGLIRESPAGRTVTAPRVEASSAVERAALGYLHANCGGCHNGRGPLASLGFSLAANLRPDGRVVSDAFATAVDSLSRFCPPGRSGAKEMRIAPGRPAESVILERMNSRVPSTQMPPLGTHLIDEAAVMLISSWIRDGLDRPSVVDADH